MVKVGSVYLDLITRWSRYIRYIDFISVLKNLSYNSIAILGGGSIGQILFEYLYSTDITVKCIIDRNPKLNFPYDINVLSPKQFLSSNIDVDAIIVTPIEGFFSISERMKTSLSCDIVSFTHFILDIDVLILLAEVEHHLKESNTRMYLLDMTFPTHYLKNPSIMEQSKAIHGASPLQDFIGLFGTDTIALDRYYNDLTECSAEYIENVFSHDLQKVIEKNGVSVLQDVRSRYLNVINGMRFTTDNPQTYDNTIHYFGNCNAVGNFAEDKYTIQSQLQRKLNAMPLNKKIFRVLNHSNELRVLDCFKQILNTDFASNDIVITQCAEMELGLKYYLNSKVIQYANINSAFDRPHDMGEVFFDNYHTNHRGYKMIADKVYSILSASFAATENDNIAQSDIILNRLIPPRKTSKVSVNSLVDTNIDDYIKFLQNEATDCRGTIGAVVMNCNPFTYGHRYLIEQACSQCDFLYIFVVEEDCSYFSFKDRLRLIKLGTSDITNVRVIRSGKFIISSITLPEYFVKETDTNLVIDASKDIGIFKDYIAPALNITKRFVGDEPFDPITNQYNQAMLEMLPKSGISVIVIPRKKTEEGETISASNVRKLLKTHNFDTVARLVPKTTLDYLQKSVLA